jgi:hypothetical protein
MPDFGLVVCKLIQIKPAPKTHKTADLHLAKALPLENLRF